MALNPRSNPARFREIFEAGRLDFDEVRRLKSLRATCPPCPSTKAARGTSGPAFLAGLALGFVAGAWTGIALALALLSTR